MLYLAEFGRRIFDPKAERRIFGKISLLINYNIIIYIIL
jgi:hypothetical protein